MTRCSKSIKKTFVSLMVIAIFSMLVGCENEVKVNEQFSTPSKTYYYWLEASMRVDIQDVMSCISEKSKNIMNSQLKNMDVFVSRLKMNTELFKTYSVSEEKINGDKAVVILKDEKGGVFVVPLKMEADGWKIDLLSLFS